jgi:hypothetical protein
MSNSEKPPTIKLFLARRKPSSMSPIYVSKLGFSGCGRRFLPKLKSEPRGARTFIDRDPDGNLVLFAA